MTPPPAVVRAPAVARLALAVPGTALGLLLTAGVALPAPAAPPTSPSRPASASGQATWAAAPTSFLLKGAGFGHGWGMSQYGADGAAHRGLSWRRILGFYYPGTRLSRLPSRTSIRVKISADDDGNLKVKAAEGLTVADRAGTALTLPQGRHYRYWKVIRSPTGLILQSRGAREPYRSYYRPKSKLAGTWWTFTARSRKIAIAMPDRSLEIVRGSVSAAAFSTSMRTVNTLPMDDYLRSVVPAEMPTSWDAAAVRAQAVAARSYAARAAAGAGSGSSYDVCDTTACQVYRGYARIDSSGRTDHETSGGNAAVAGTAAQVLRWGRGIALTQFASSNGGATAQGDYPYLRARPDPYDGVLGSHRWSQRVSATSLSRVYGVGTVTGLKIVRRDGSGPWGGRVRRITIVGSKRSVTVSGSSFQATYGLRSTLFTVA